MTEGLADHSCLPTDMAEARVTNELRFFPYSQRRWSSESRNHRDRSLLGTASVKSAYLNDTMSRGLYLQVVYARPFGRNPLGHLVVALATGRTASGSLADQERGGGFGSASPAPPTWRKTPMRDVAS